MFDSWAAYAFLLLDGRHSSEPELLCLRNYGTSSEDYVLPGSEMREGDANSLDTLIRGIFSKTGIRVLPHQVTRVPLPNKGKVGGKNFRLRFYRVVIRDDQFIDRASGNPKFELHFLPVSQIARLGDNIEPSADYIRMTGYLSVTETEPAQQE